MFTGFSIKKGFLCIILVVLFAGFAISFEGGAAMSFDKSVLDFILTQRTPDMDIFYSIFTRLGDFWFYAVVCITLLVLPATRFQYGIPLTFNSILGVVIRHFIKVGLARPRPFLAAHLVTETSYSFPSGHAMSSLLFWGTLYLSYRYYLRNDGASLKLYTNNPHPAGHYIRDYRKLGIIALAMSLYCIMMGYSRLYTGVHWPTDILGGWALASAMLCLY